MYSSLCASPNLSIVSSYRNSHHLWLLFFLYCWEGTRNLFYSGPTVCVSCSYAGAIFADACLKGLNGVPDVVECSFVHSNVTELPFFSSKVIDLNLFDNFYVKASILITMGGTSHEFF